MNRDVAWIAGVLTALLLIPLGLFFLESLEELAIVSAWVMGSQLGGAHEAIGDFRGYGYAGVFASFGLFAIFGLGLWALFKGSDYLGVDWTMRWSPSRVRLPHEEYELENGPPEDDGLAGRRSPEPDSSTV